MGVDELDERLQVASGRIVRGVVLQFSPGREQHEFGVIRAVAFFQLAAPG